MAEAQVARPSAAGGSAAAVFTVTIFASALLLFLVQPMFARFALPRLGGSAAVWSVALVFFQAVLLLGYAYSHLLIRHMGLKAGVVVHGLVMLAAVICLPIGISSSWGAPPEHFPALWLIGLFGASIGLPFFAISANAPLLQSWFSRMGDARSSDPYFLYAFSNGGSLLALMAFPFLIEPAFGLRQQSWLWSSGYIVLIALVLYCGHLAARAAPAAVSMPQVPAGADAASWRQRLIWIMLAAVPSGLLVATTAHIATDIVSAPLLWVVPLGLYLLTFIIAFQPRPLIPHAALMARTGTLVAPLCLFALIPPLLLQALVRQSATAFLLILLLQLVAVFLLMLLCHGELARLRPPALRLTEFYLLTSVGGVVGGTFASLLAPNVFNDLVEYPGLIVAAFVAVSLSGGGGKAAYRRALLGFAAAALSVGLVRLSAVGGDLLPVAVAMGAIVLILALFWLFGQQPLGLAAVLAAVAITVPLASRTAEALLQTRSFYGVMSVYQEPPGRIHVLLHGSTMHGLQTFEDAKGKPLPRPPRSQAYYYPEGPIGTAIQELRAARGKLESVAVVGLGAGSMLCLKKPGESWRFFELDPEVIRIASDERYFTFLRDCGPAAGLVAGDGRLRLQEVPDASYDLIVLDAFSSDSIPVHMLTREALGLYLAKLKPGGLVVFHISNRYMELSDVVEGAAESFGLEAWHALRDKKAWHAEPDLGDVPGKVSVVGKTPGSLGNFDADPRWRRASPGEAAEPWTDDYSNIIGAMWRHRQSPP